MINTKYEIVFLFLLNIIILTKCFFFNDEVGMKVFSCMNVMDKKFNKGEQQPNVFSPMMLTCFIRITNYQTERVLSDFERGTNSLEPEEINDLTNVEFLKTIPEKEIKKKSAQLEKIITEFQEFDHDYTKLKESKKLINDDNEDEDDDNDNEHKFGKFKIKKGKRKSKQNIVNNSLWIPIFGLIFIFVILIISRLSSDLDKDKDNKNDDKKNEKENNNNKEEQKINKKEKEILKEKEKPKTE